MSEKKEVLLLRHGTTAGNLKKQYIGITDESLCPEGIAALSGLHYPAADLVYISPLLRCRETAGILFPAARLIPVDHLREMNFGHFEGRSYKDMAQDGEYRAWVDSNCEAPIPGGEDKAAFTERCCRAFTEVVAQTAASRLVFVVHGGTIMAILSRFGKPERGYYDWYCANGHGFSAEYDPADGTLRILGEV